MTMNKQRVLWISLGLVVAVGAAWWFQQTPAGGPTSAAAAPSGAGRSGPPAVEVTTVQTARLQDEAQAVGTLVSKQSVTLRPEVSGRVARLGFADGAAVQRGQVLLQLDDALQRAELSQAQAQLSIARANAKRNEELVAQNFVAQRVLDESRAQLQVAQAQVALAQARLERMQIKAPFGGRVGISAVNVGEFIKDGTAVVNLEDNSVLMVDFRLSERYQTRIAVGQSVQVQVDALPGQTFAAKVTALDPLVEANGRAVAIRAQMPPEAARQLRAGMFARVMVIFGVNETALVVPEEALVPQGGRQWVVVVQPETGGEQPVLKARRIAVTTGLRRANQVEITEGLVAGQTIVVAGQQRIQQDGTTVRVVDLNAAPRKAP
jgi:membrane fusion protein (multidrug efflux system)